MAKINYQLAALAIVWDRHHGQRKACEKYEISLKSLSRYKIRLKTDTELSALVDEIDLQYRRDAVKEMIVEARVGYRVASETMRDLMLRLQKQPANAPVNPAVIDSVSKALATYGELIVTKEVVDRGNGPSVEDLLAPSAPASIPPPDAALPPAGNSSAPAPGSDRVN